MGGEGKRGAGRRGGEGKGGGREGSFNWVVEPLCGKVYH